MGGGDDATGRNAFVDDRPVAFDNTVGNDSVLEESFDLMRRYTMPMPVPVREMIESDEGKGIC
jgi:hypothetical protein